MMNRTKKITYTAIFAAIASILMFFEFPIPFMPPFLKVDLSGAVVLIGALALGIGPALSIALIKDLIHLMYTTTGGSGELADFLMTSSFVIIAYLIFNKSRTTTNMVLGGVGGSLVMACVGMLTNKFIIIPFYSLIMPIEAIIAACHEINPLIGSLNSYLIFGVLPFNLIKGAILTTISILVYQKLRVGAKKNIAQVNL